MPKVNVIHLFINLKIFRNFVSALHISGKQESADFRFVCGCILGYLQPYLSYFLLIFKRHFQQMCLG